MATSGERCQGGASLRKGSVTQRVKSSLDTQSGAMRCRGPRYLNSSSKIGSDKRAGQRLDGSFEAAAIEKASNEHSWKQAISRYRLDFPGYA